ncbi:MAG: aldehyde ferredoxin oxidoreductase N-terminal domain-containing protein [Candidatus Binatia bacterium]
MTSVEHTEHLFAGYIGFVDLSKRRSWRERVPRQWAKDFIGGQGIASWLALDLIPRGCDPFGPDNAVILSAGPFIGTMVPGAGKLLLSTKCPANNRYGYASSGIFADQLKRAGFDHVVIMGTAVQPVYLLLQDDEIAIIDAAGLWGLDTYETTDALWAKYPDASIVAIGPAGENLVPSAIVLGNKFSTAGSGGTGAVLGSKRVKAVVAQGTRPVTLACPPRFMSLTKQAIKEVMGGDYTMLWRELGTLIQYNDFAGPTFEARKDAMVGDIDTTRYNAFFREKIKDKSITCPSCPVACKHRLHVLEGPHRGTVIPVSCSAGTFSGPFIWQPRLPMERYDEAVKSTELINRMGISTVTGPLLDMIHLFNDGVLTKEDTGGLDLSYGNLEGINQLILQTAHRTGFGAEVAGPFGEWKKALAPKLDAYVDFRGQNIGTRDRGEDTGGPKRWTVLGFAPVIDPRSNGPTTAYHSPAYMVGRSAASLRRWGERIGIPRAELDVVFTGERDGYRTAALTRYVELYNLVEYSLGMCQRPFINRAMPIDRVAALYTAGTGIEVTPADLYASASRIITVQRLFNVREGWTRAEEEYPAGYLRAEDEAELRTTLDEYYRLQGWSIRTGIPTEATLSALGIPPQSARKAAR